MKRIGITGQSGFIGTHLAAYVASRNDTELVPFDDSFFQDELRLREFVHDCDVIVHLAAASRMPNEEALYQLNVGLVQQVIDAMEVENVRPLVLFSSSIHEMRDTAYGRAKLEGRKRFEEWATRNGASFVGFVFPNIYGPGARVHYASFIANFAWELQHGEQPKMLVDASMTLKYVGDLCDFIGQHFTHVGIDRIEVPYDIKLKVSDILDLLRMFRQMQEHKLPLESTCENNLKNLYTTFLSYK